MRAIARRILAVGLLAAASLVTSVAVQAQSHILPSFTACLAQVQAKGGGATARSECYWEHWSRQASGR